MAVSALRVNTASSYFRSLNKQPYWHVKATTLTIQFPVLRRSGSTHIPHHRLANVEVSVFLFFVSPQMMSFQNFIIIKLDCTRFKRFELLFFFFFKRLPVALLPLVVVG